MSPHSPPQEAGSAMLVGPHVSMAGGLEKAFANGEALGATAIQLFTRSQRTWNTRPLEEEEVLRFHQAWEKSPIREVMSHDSYLINLGSPDPDKLARSRKAFEEEVVRCDRLAIRLLNFHPGAAMGQPAKECLNRIAESVLSTMEARPDSDVVYVLENTAGQGSAVGADLEDIAWILDKIGQPEKTGVCLDTCHLYAAGYDIRSPEGWDEFWKTFEAAIGLKHLKAFHVNDIQKPLGCRVDRHAPLGEGHLGWDFFHRMAADPRFGEIPMFLETPGPEEVWTAEVARMREFRRQGLPQAGNTV
ncbi:MAG: deoxyribonuclease IV [Deltaproteobacteria bacterium]|nr:deoxyribonuclease IV [Deltaproteobacteria bacterium]